MGAASLGRFRALFDIYSPRPLHRGVVLGCMALGVWLLANGVATRSTVGAIPFLLLVWANHERFLATVDGLFEQRTWLVLAVPLAVYAAPLIVVPPIASDDLLRHIGWAFWPGGYRDMYVRTALPPAELYPTFDWVMGALARLAGAAAAMWTAQALACAGLVLVFVLAARRLLAGHPMWAVLTLAALILVLQLISGRLSLARPEIFMTIWALSALLARGSVGTVVWSATGLALGSGYWLAPLYYPAAMLLPIGGRARALVFAALCLCWVGMWWWLTDGRLFEVIRWPLEQVGNRVPGLGVMENESIVNVLLTPPMLALALASVWAARRGGDVRLLLLAGFFLLSNQARYGGIVAPLLALHALSAAPRLRLRWPAMARSAAVAIGSVALAWLSAGWPRYGDLPGFNLPAGAVVLTSFGQATYSIPFANLGLVRVAPAFEVGAADPAVQRLVLAIGRGSVDCAELKDQGFTHLVESTLRGPPPPCVTLAAMQGGWRLWRIDP
ncbi:MAG: hypothetical protein M9907_05880 [Burkholderiaceae bacterium]|nr:hypothetical protein [Burkholderiaceae bacterium]